MKSYKLSDKCGHLPTVKDARYLFERMVKYTPALKATVSLKRNRGKTHRGYYLSLKTNNLFLGWGLGLRSCQDCLDLGIPTGIVVKNTEE